MAREQSDILIRIKRAVLQKRTRFSKKAILEMEADGLTELDVEEAILNAPAIYKKVRSRNPYRRRAVEYLYIIQSVNLEGVLVYTKGKFIKEGEAEVFYFLISSKRAL